MTTVLAWRRPMRQWRKSVTAGRAGAHRTELDAVVVRDEHGRLLADIPLSICWPSTAPGAAVT